MTEINLLPWRAEQRERDKKVFTWTICTGVIVTTSIVFLINYYASRLVSNKLDRNRILQNEIAVLDKQNKEMKLLRSLREKLISRISLVQNFQFSRIQSVHLFDELIKIMPPDIDVTKLERRQDKVSLWGFSESNTSISLLMSRIETNHWIQNPVLFEIRKIEEKNQPSTNEFILNFILHAPTSRSLPRDVGWGRPVTKKDE